MQPQFRNGNASACATCGPPKPKRGSRGQRFCGSTCRRRAPDPDLASGCTFDLWADDVPICPVEVRDLEVWVKPTFGYADPAAHWRRRLHDGLAHNLGLVIAKAVQGELAADVPPSDAARQIVLLGARHG